MDMEHRDLAEKFVFGHIYKQDGKAGQRITDLIIQMGKEAG